MHDRWCRASMIARRATVVTLAGATAFALMLAGRTLKGQEEVGRDYPATDWPVLAGNLFSSRHSTLTEINTDTINRLGGAWVTRLEGGASSRATPVVQAGVLYLTGGASVLAIDARTGETIWRSQSDDSASPRVPGWQGVGLGGGLVFIGTRSAEVAALRQDSGELVWTTSISNQLSVPISPGARTIRNEADYIGEFINSAPLFVDGKIFVGLGSGDWGGQGKVVALDAATGAEQWTFHVIPKPGEFGHDTWPQDNNSWKLGGGGVWLNGAADSELGLIYFVTGNPAPMYGGELRKGDNLFTASVLALDAATGERRWHYQVVRHDLWDADIATPLLLYDIEIDGQTRKALAAMRADGYLFLFDRETGETLVPIEDRPVPQDAFLHTAPTQPFPVGGESIVPDCSFWRDRVPPPFELICSGFTPPSLTEHTIVGLGAPIPRVRVTPMSFSPQTGYIYAMGLGHVGRARRFADPYISSSGRGNPLTLPPPIGVLAAIDARTARIAWKHELPSGRLATSGPLTTAGGLMFWGAADGLVEAYDAQTGERVWTFQTAPRGSRVRPGPAATYQLDDRQFIVIPMGNELWTFALDGTVPQRGEPGFESSGDPVPWFVSTPSETDTIETATLVPNPFWAVGGKRNALDEHAFNPVHALVMGGARVLFLNNGQITHTIAARDGSWTTGELQPGRWQHVTFEQPGTLLYHCTDHPWAIGEITVKP